jgi:hypothetical protein
MRDFLARFRFGDFAAYFLPGMALLGGSAAVFWFTPLQDLIKRSVLDASWIQAMMFACAAYLCGALISGSSYRLIPALYAASRFRRYSDSRLAVQPRTITEPVQDAFISLFGSIGETDWSETHFYLIRSVVHERLPHASGEAMRQNDLMRLRENMLIPLVVWGLAAWLFAFSRFDTRPLSAWGLGSVATVLAYVFAARLACRAADNRAREVREICAAFLVGDRLRVWVPQVDSVTSASSSTTPIGDSLAPDARSAERLSIAAPPAGSA